MRAALRLAAVVTATVIVVSCARRSPLLEPKPEALARAAPDSFVVQFETTRGNFDMIARRAWAPAGVDRFYYLARHGYYDGARFFRVVRGFVAQFGLAANPVVSAVWRGRTIPDDTVRASNLRGTVSFARGGRASRTTQLYINLGNNARLDTLNGFGFPPIGEVMDGGMRVVDSLYSGYGEAPPRGTGPMQDSIRLQGEPYLARVAPKLDGIIHARIVREWKR